MNEKKRKRPLMFMEPLNGIVSYDSTALLRQHKQGEGE